MPKRPIRSSARSRDEYGIFVEMLSTAREEAGMTQAALAERLSKPQSWVAKGEAGTRRVDAVELLQILEALQIEPGDFIRRLRHRLWPLESRSPHSDVV